MNESYWKIDEFLNFLEQNDIEPFKLDNQWTPRNFKDFVKRQPKLFGASNRKVWPLESIFLQNPKDKLDTIQPMKEPNYESMLHDDGLVKKSNDSRFPSSTNSLNSLPSTMSATPAQPLANQLVPKREQTYEEISRTQKFAEECLELLKHLPNCRLPFNKFIPAYHQHFGRQCRLADYGFTKLIELIEAIPTIIEIT